MSKPPMADPRNDLLKAIRDGIKLRKVEKIEQKEVDRGNGLHDVASILARRVCITYHISVVTSSTNIISESKRKKIANQKQNFLLNINIFLYMFVVHITQSNLKE